MIVWCAACRCENRRFLDYDGNAIEDGSIVESGNATKEGEDGYISFLPKFAFGANAHQDCYWGGR